MLVGQPIPVCVMMAWWMISMISMVATCAKAENNGLQNLVGKKASFVPSFSYTKNPFCNTL